MTTKTIKTVLFASLIAAMILPFSGMNFADASKSSTRAEIIEEIDRRVATLNEELTNNSNDKNLEDAKQTYMIGKKLIQLQSQMEQAETDEDREKIGQRIATQMSKLSSYYENLPNSSHVKQVSFIEKLLSIPYASALTDYWLLSSPRTQGLCGSVSASTTGFVDGAIWPASAEWGFTNIYPSQIVTGNFPNCDTEDFDHSTSKLFKLGSPLTICWHDVSNPNDTYEESCFGIFEGDIIIAETQGHYGDWPFFTWFNSYPMIDSLWV